MKKSILANVAGWLCASLLGFLAYWLHEQLNDDHPQILRIVVIDGALFIAACMLGWVAATSNTKAEGRNQAERNTEARLVSQAVMDDKDVAYVLYLASPGSGDLRVDNPFGLRPRFSGEQPPIREVVRSDQISFGALLAQVSTIPVIQFAGDIPEPGPGVVIDLLFGSRDVVAPLIKGATHIFILPIYSHKLLSRLRRVVELGCLDKSTFIIPGKVFSGGEFEVPGLAEMRRVVAEKVYLPEAQIRTQLIRLKGRYVSVDSFTRSALRKYWWIDENAERKLLRRSQL